MKKIEDLDNKNLIVLFNTAREISSELELENENTITIKAEQDKVEANLQPYLPNNGYDVIAELRRLRHKAVKYLQNNHIIFDYRFCNDDQDIAISVNEEEFSQFYKDITGIYEGRYEKQNKQKSDTLTLFNFEKEKIAIKNIKSGTEHRAYRDKWINPKRVLNVIDDWILPTPLTMDGTPTNVPEITLEKDYFFEKGIPQKKEYVINGMLLFLENNKIIDIKKPKIDDEIYIITRDKKGIFLNGRTRIILKDEVLFRKHLTGLSTFVNYIEKDGRSRFPMEYGAETKSIPEPKKITYLDSGFDHNLIRNNETTVEKQLSEINRKLEGFAKNDESKSKIVQKKIIKEDGKSVLFSIPANRTLKDITIKFLEDNKFEISTVDKTAIFHGSELGFLKTKNGKYVEKESLKFLMQLSANDGVYPLKGLSQEERLEATTRKKELTKKLQEIFETREDPFYKYNKELDEHKTRFGLIPPLILKAKTYRDKDIYDKREKDDNPYADLGEEYKNKIEN
jgi:hypothetical protein